MGNTYRQLIAANVRAARAHAGLTQDEVAARMRVLGYGWTQGVVGHVESGRKNLLSCDILAVAVVLETTVAALMAPSPDGSPVDLGGGWQISAVSARNRAYGMGDPSVRWQDDHLSIVSPASPWAARAADRAP